ncbi:hypothetical protein M405DRAFT_857037 [Rhizopogon salebrosus TDB-379]|nr:hypothetical protein M405DRAFT_857037 [Rhizopogon salebrosus TDB-379]
MCTSRDHISSSEFAAAVVIMSLDGDRASQNMSHRGDRYGSYKGPQVPYEVVVHHVPQVRRASFVAAISDKMSTIAMVAPPSVASSQDVTLPAIPELTNPNFLDLLLPPVQDAQPIEVTEKPPAPSNAMMNALRSTAHHKLTENIAPAFGSTLSATLDAFQGVRPYVSGSAINDYLFKAWAEDPALTLRIIWSLRSIHDGKADKELFYMAFGWLFEHHPRTALSNLHLLVEPVCTRIRRVKGVEGAKRRESMPHGYWKDLLNILALATVDELNPSSVQYACSTFLHNFVPRNSRPHFKSNSEQEAWSREKRDQMHNLNHARIVKKLQQPKYRALYVAVARLFADRLARDDSILLELACLPANVEAKHRVRLIFSLSMATKWAPTPGGSHDRVTNITSAICILLHHAQVTSSLTYKIPVSLTPSALELHVLRSFLRRHILTPSRRLKSLPEPLMSANRWSEIIYSRVASICMNNNKENFFKHDADRFVSYLTDVESGKKQISGATLLPHELMVVLDPEGTVSLGETVIRMSRAHWSMNTNLDAVFLKLLLPLAKKHAVPQDQMIKRIFVFTDMQFDDSQSTHSVYGGEMTSGQSVVDWETNHDVIERAYKEAGYEMPQIVYWDLSNPEHHAGITAPVTGDRKGVALLNGFSPSLLKVFMNVEEEEMEEGHDERPSLALSGTTWPATYKETS